MIEVGDDHQLDYQVASPQCQYRDEDRQEQSQLKVFREEESAQSQIESEISHLRNIILFSQQQILKVIN